MYRYRSLLMLSVIFSSIQSVENEHIHPVVCFAKWGPSVTGSVACFSGRTAYYATTEFGKACCATNSVVSGVCCLFSTYMAYESGETCLPKDRIIKFFKNYKS